MTSLLLRGCASPLNPPRDRWGASPVLANRTRVLPGERSMALGSLGAPLQLLLKDGLGVGVVGAVL